MFTPKKNDFNRKNEALNTELDRLPEGTDQLKGVIGKISRTAHEIAHVYQQDNKTIERMTETIENIRGELN